MESEASSSTLAIEVAALVWRRSPETGLRELAFLNDRSVRVGASSRRLRLPREQVEQRESPQDKALQAAQQLGIGKELRPSGLAGCRSELRDGQLEVVVYWNFEHVSPSGGSRDDAPVRWRSIPDAIAELDHPEVAAIVRRAADMQAIREHPATPQRRIRFLRRWWQDPSTRRLAVSLPPYRAQFEHLVSMVPRSSDGGSSTQETRMGSWIGIGRQLLNRAENALRAGETELGWKYFHEAQRVELYGLALLDPGALRTRASEIRHEAGKLSADSWRKKSIEASLADPEKLTGHPADVRVVAESHRILTEEFANRYEKLRFLRRQTSVLIGLAAVVLLLLVLREPLGLDRYALTFPAAAGIGSQAPPAAQIDGGSGQPTPPASLGENSEASSPALMNTPQTRPDPGIIPIALFGVLGAAISALFRVSKTAIDITIPAQRITGITTLAHVTIGAVAAVVVCMAAEAGLAGFTAESPSIYAVLAFASGFSERLLPSTMDKVKA